MDDKILGIINDHELWRVTGGKYGSCADLHGDDLRDVNLRRANLHFADLTGADLRDVDLTYADLRNVNLTGADMRDANLSIVDLSHANMRDADLTGTDLLDAVLDDANLSGARGLVSTIDFMEGRFERCADGYIAYKTFSSQYVPPDDWKIEAGSVISENVNFTRTQGCGSGVNVATLDWVKSLCMGKIWRVLIRWEWMCGVCAPYGSDGKIRCERVELLEVVK